MNIRTIVSAVFYLALASSMRGQSAAEISGVVTDPSGAVVPQAQVRIVRQGTAMQREGQTNGSGLYTFSALEPGTYSLEVLKTGFQTASRTDLVLNVGAPVRLNIQLRVGNVAETVTVGGGAPLVQTLGGDVGTVVDRQFVGNMPLNGRSFQNLIALAPGVISTAPGGNGAGQFTVNGQRQDTNQFTVDGTNANNGITPTFGVGIQGSGGSAAASVSGGYNSLVSVDDLQEFQIQTSTFAPEFGRTPGGQVSLVTRSGSNAFHGDAFDYLRNNFFDAHDYFVNYNQLKQPPLRQNDFGGVLGGPLVKNKLFFFVSYEGLRLTQPTVVANACVPSLAARATAAAAPGSDIGPYLNAFPVPSANVPCGAKFANGVVDPNLDTFNAAYSNPTSLDSTSARIDYNPTSKMTIFGRYSESPSSIESQGGATILDQVLHYTSLTLGSTAVMSPSITNDFRVNYTRSSGISTYHVAPLFGAVPFVASYDLPAGYSPTNTLMDVDIQGISGPRVTNGIIANNPNHAFNAVDSLIYVKGRHQMKFGGDFRRLAPFSSPRVYGVSGNLTPDCTVSVASQTSCPKADAFDPWATTGRSGTQSGVLRTQAFGPQQFIFNSLSVYAQDTWQVSPRLNVTFGVRWELDPAPFSPSGQGGFVINNFTIYNSPTSTDITLLPIGTSLYATTYNNFAPRVGLAFQTSNDPRWTNVIRGGFGVFYDTAATAGQADAGPYTSNNVVGTQNVFYPLINPNNPSSVSIPLPVPQPAPYSLVTAPAPNLKLPYTYQYNFTVEQSLGEQQMLSIGYVGALGRRLLKAQEFDLNTSLISAAASNLSTVNNANTGTLVEITNLGHSNYNSLQVQYKRRLADGLQVLSSYTWSHSLDNGTNPTGITYPGNILVSPSGQVPFINRDYASSDFDIRHLFTAAISYNTREPWKNPLAKHLLGGWGIDTNFHYNSAPPVDVFNTITAAVGTRFQYRPNYVPGQPLYLYGANCSAAYGLGTKACPGGVGLNRAAFAPAAAGTQGSLGRNALRGFPLTQWDVALRRDFALYENFHLQFRADVFNVINHPNFAPELGNQAASYGLATQTLASALGTASTFNAQYQNGGPRSMQLSLKLLF